VAHSDISKVFQAGDIVTFWMDIWSDQFICWIIFVIIFRKLRGVMYSALNDALHHVVPYTGNVEADLYGNGYLQFSSLFQPDLRPADNSLAFDLRRPILRLKMRF